MKYELNLSKNLVMVLEERGLSKRDLAKIISTSLIEKPLINETKSTSNVFYDIACDYGDSDGQCIACGGSVCGHAGDV